MAYESNSASFAGRSEKPALMSMSAPILDWMLFMQRQVLNFQKQALSLYGLGSAFDRSNARASTAARQARDVEVIPLGRETLNVETRVVNQGTTRIRRFVVETPVEEKVPLRQERVIVERRRPIAVSSTGDTLTDKTIEMSDTMEVPVVWTSVELAEEVVVRREVKERVEAVRGTVRHDEVEIQEVGSAPRESAEPHKVPAMKAIEAKPAASGQDHKTSHEQKPAHDSKAASGSTQEPARPTKV